MFFLLACFRSSVSRTRRVRKRRKLSGREVKGRARLGSGCVTKALWTRTKHLSFSTPPLLPRRLFFRFTEHLNRLYIYLLKLFRIFFVKIHLHIWKKNIKTYLIICHSWIEQPAVAHLKSFQLQQHWNSRDLTCNSPFLPLDISGVNKKGKFYVFYDNTPHLKICVFVLSYLLGDLLKL